MCVWLFVHQADPTYVIPGAAIHSFLMFAPFFALYEKRGTVLGLQSCWVEWQWIPMQEDAPLSIDR